MIDRLGPSERDLFMLMCNTTAVVSNTLGCMTLELRDTWHIGGGGGTQKVLANFLKSGESYPILFWKYIWATFSNER